MVVDTTKGRRVSRSTQSVAVHAPCLHQHGLVELVANRDLWQSDHAHLHLVTPSHFIRTHCDRGTFTVDHKNSNNHNSAHASNFTPISLLYLVLLALNYAIIPCLSGQYVHASTNKRLLALVKEVAKMGLGIGGWILISLTSVAKRSCLSSFGYTFTCYSHPLQ